MRRYSNHLPPPPTHKPFPTSPRKSLGFLTEAHALSRRPGPTSQCGGGERARAGTPAGRPLPYCAERIWGNRKRGGRKGTTANFPVTRGCPAAPSGVPCPLPAAREWKAPTPPSPNSAALQEATRLAAEWPAHSEWEGARQPIYGPYKRTPKRRPELPAQNDVLREMKT